MPHPSSADGSSRSLTGLNSQNLQYPRSLPTSPNRLHLEEPITNPWRYVKSTVRKPYSPAVVDHAAPLSPLRDRDLEIMAEWFDQEDMPEIEAEVNFHLGMMYPEPIWEEGLDFLYEHL